jgi:predicted 2-oxoglutarate/Fe(II)-dependent dioxygenase YbiX
MITQSIIFTKEECSNIINLIKNDYKHWKSEDRDYVSHSIYLSEETAWIFDKLKIYFENATGNKIKKMNKNIHFHIFDKGCKFEIHNDLRENRLYGVGSILNDNFEGGDFKFYDADNTILHKLQGNGYIFNSNINHEITTITNGKRYSILWFIKSENILINRNSII